MRAEHFLAVLDETDVVVLLQPQVTLIRGLEAAAGRPVYTLYDADLKLSIPEDSVFQTIDHARFVELIAVCAQSRTW